jgi:N-methylhydantoinase B
VETAKPALANTAGDGVRYGACGMLGGQDAPPHRYRLLSDGRDPRVLKTKETNIPVQPGDMFEVRSGGGGGWGPAEKRSAAARERDLAEGLLTVSGAP